MPICTSCGQENVEEARFCLACGGRLDALAAARDARKTVTVLFSDVVGSTALGERLDPESLRGVMARYFEVARLVVERHEGLVEKFIGDAVMAVFGIPVLHEDDALRAVRAAAELRDSLAELNDGLVRDYGTTLELRIGVNTGEVLVRNPDPTGTLTLGDAVNVAARLQAAAQPGEILLGEASYRLVRDAVRAQPVEPLVLKGKAEPVPAFRLLGVLPRAEALSRHFEMPLVGRELELAQLRQAFARAVRERRCHLVTVYGQAGIGKSRLSQELAVLLEDEASVLRGRCLSYGEGITYWPVREIVAQAGGGLGVRMMLDGSPDADAVAERLEIAIGVGTGGAVKEEIAWAMRKLVEVLARERPVLLEFEDIHWAEPTLLDLIEYLSDWVRDVAVLIVCLARPELLDQRPTWGGGKLNAASVLLDPLSQDESSELMQALPAGAALSLAARARIAASAEGNPLFLEQMLAMLAQQKDGDDEITVPPAIQGLLAARLEHLAPEERRLLECASVEGEVFHVGGVVALAQERREAVEAGLMDLVRKELIRAEPATVPGDDAFRFRHALIRDASYTGLSKEARSDLHERHAAWLEHILGEHAGEAEELLGYHLEQAYRYRSELALGDRKALELAEHAHRRLGSAGRLALRRGDARAAVNLLERAHGLPSPDEPLWLEVAIDLGSALFQAGELEQSDSVLSNAIERASGAGEWGKERHAWLLLGMLRVFSQPDRIDVSETLREVEQSLGVLEGAGDDLALTHAMLLLTALYPCSNAVLQREAAERALEHARRAGSRLDEAWSLYVISYALFESPTPTAEGLQICERQLLELRHAPLGTALMQACVAALLATHGRFGEARALVGRSRAEIQGLGIGTLRTTIELWSARVEMLAGDPQAAERAAHAAVEQSAEIGDDWYYVLASLDLARAICDQGRPEECLRILDESELHPTLPDLEIVIKRQATRALALAHLGRLNEAEPLARAAVASAVGTHFTGFHANALLVLSEVLGLTDRSAEAVPLVAEAIALFDRKGNAVAAAGARALLSEARPPSP